MLQRLFALLLLLLPCVAHGQTARISLDVDRHILSVGEELQVTVEIEVEGQEGHQQYLPPAFKNFTVADGGMSSQNVEVINWRVRRHESYSYVVVPQKEGTFTIGPAAITVGGRMIRSNTPSVKVNAGATPSPLPSPAPPQPSAESIPADRASSSVFLAATATPQKVYVGEQIVAVWSLYTQSSLLSFQPGKQPKADDFWSEDLNSPQRLQLEQTIVGDRVFYVAVLVRKALFPQKPGRLSISPMEAQILTKNEFMEGPATRRSEELIIEVKSLPVQGKPLGFPEGNVGQFELFATLDKPTVRAGDAVTLKVVLRGVGNLGQIKLPTINQLDGFKIYDPKISDRLELDQGVTGEKIFEYLLIPVRGGRLSIPVLHLDYFDPRTGTYRKATTDPLSVVVTGQVVPDSTGKLDIKRNVLGPTIRPPRPVARLVHRSAEIWHRGPIFWLFFLFPATVLIVIGAGERLRTRLIRETPRTLRRAAARLSSSHLRRAQEWARQGKAGGFFGEIAMALGTQLDHQLDLRVEGLTREELHTTMTRAGFPEELVRSVLQELDNCDFARFTPSASDERQMREALARTRRLLDEIGRTVLRQEGDR